MRSFRHQLELTDSLVLGIDGGGSKTVAWLGRLSHIGHQQAAQGLAPNPPLNVAQGTTLPSVEKIGAGQAGPSNPRAIGFDLALGNIERAILAAFENAKLSPRPVASACLCLAGTGRQDEKKAVLGWAKWKELAEDVWLASEAEAVLAAVDPEIPQQSAEVALICGTGSLAWGRSSIGDTPRRSGGWGYLLGDEGSGFWLGQQLLQLACKIADGRANEPAILASVLEELQLNSPDQLVGWCYERSGSRERIAGLAPIAFHNSKSPLVQEFIHRGARELTQMVSSVVSQLRAERYVLAMAGSVLVCQNEYRKLMEQELELQSQVPAKIHVVAQPVAGALKLAGRLQS